MLVLSRKVNEQIVIGDGIVVTVVSIRGGHVRLGIEAPGHIAVHREEVYKLLQQQKQQERESSQPSNSGAEKGRVREGSGGDR